MKRIGIYAIRHAATGRIYVGSAVDIIQRWRVHRSLLRHGRHHSIKLQRAWDKYGEAAFEFCVLETVAEVGGLITREQFWLDHLSAAHPRKGYNVATVAGSRLGTTQSAATRAKVSSAHLGRTRDEAWRLNISKGLRGKRKSAEHRARLSAAKRGKALGPQSAEHREKRLAAVRAACLAKREAAQCL